MESSRNTHYEIVSLSHFVLPFIYFIIHGDCSIQRWAVSFVASSIGWHVAVCIFLPLLYFSHRKIAHVFPRFTHTHIQKLATIIHIYKIKYATDRHRTRCQQETTKCFYDCFIFDWFSVVCLTVLTLKHLSAAPRITPAKWNARRNWIAWWMDTK